MMRRRDAAAQSGTTARPPRRRSPTAVATAAAPAFTGRSPRPQRRRRERRRSPPLRRVDDPARADHRRHASRRSRRSSSASRHARASAASAWPATAPADAHICGAISREFADANSTTVIYVWDVVDPAGNRLHRIQGTAKDQGRRRLGGGLGQDHAGDRRPHDRRSRAMAGGPRRLTSRPFAAAD